ncbi:hypothetical protein C7M84_013278 [Penaeus vannamei]|uniref:Uncharacterized protein n=1 Tax=Penaeus vannamei TaxID=6689 RepID=A0A3R7NWE1_PENVA|nr:hypothetical protein C7M84_013278 [Penaeus vannamei]
MLLFFIFPIQPSFSQSPIPYLPIPFPRYSTSSFFLFLSLLSFPILAPLPSPFLLNLLLSPFLSCPHLPYHPLLLSLPPSHNSFLPLTTLPLPSFSLYPLPTRSSLLPPLPITPFPTVLFSPIPSFSLYPLPHRFPPSYSPSLPSHTVLPSYLPPPPFPSLITPLADSERNLPRHHNNLPSSPIHLSRPVTSNRPIVSHPTLHPTLLPTALLVPSLLPHLFLLCPLTALLTLPHPPPLSLLTPALTLTFSHTTSPLLCPSALALPSHSLHAPTPLSLHPPPPLTTALHSRSTFLLPSPSTPTTLHPLAPSTLLLPSPSPPPPPPPFPSSPTTPPHPPPPPPEPSQSPAVTRLAYLLIGSDQTDFGRGVPNDRTRRGDVRGAGARGTGRKNVQNGHRIPRRGSWEPIILGDP